MHNNDLLEINISRIIPARKWKIVRLLTKIWEFPSYVPSIKESSVIQKKHNVIQTKWRIQLDEMPINWIEEDRFAFNENAIYFTAIEGDLAEFRGKWTFEERADGTEVKITVFINAGIPAINNLANNHIKKLVTKNFEAILDGLENRLIFRRYISCKQGNSDKVAGFGIIGHLYSYSHLEKSLKILEPNFKMPSREFMNQLYHIIPSFKLCDIKNFKSKTGETVDGYFIIATFIPDMVEKDKWLVYSKVTEACKIAEKHSVGVVALGGFTSIIAEKIGRKISDEVEVPATTGNTFTAAMAIDGILKAAELLGINLPKAKLAVIGGTGDIGSACARVLVNAVKQLTITGKTKINLKIIGSELAKRKKARIIATTDNKKAVRDADIVIAVASASSAILNVDWFKPGAVICDVGYPKNISYAPVTRNDILIFSGGLAKTPTQIAFPIDIGLPSPDTLYGCFSESIILALEKRYESFSAAKWHITPDKIEEIRALGKKHGFEVADFYWGDKLIAEPMLGKIREIIKIKK